MAPLATRRVVGLVGDVLVWPAAWLARPGAWGPNPFRSRGPVRRCCRGVGQVPAGWQGAPEAVTGEVDLGGQSASGWGEGVIVWFVRLVVPPCRPVAVACWWESERRQPFCSSAMPMEGLPTGGQGSATSWLGSIGIAPVRGSSGHRRPARRVARQLIRIGLHEVMERTALTDSTGSREVTPVGFSPSARSRLSWFPQRPSRLKRSGSAPGW